MPVCTGSELRMDCICRSDAAGPYQWRQTAPAEETKTERTGMIYGSRIQRESHCSNRAVAFQTVKEPLFSAHGNRGSGVVWGKNINKSGKTGVVPTPNCQFFQVHGSIFKPDPS